MLLILAKADADIYKFIPILFADIHNDL